MASGLVAKDLLALLETRHSSDVFVPECKDGPTHGASHNRLDGWAMKSSWTNPTVYGYEIKVSRSDFLQDSKWTNYLPMCNELYFVCPSGLIAPTEVPEGVGLLWAAKTGTRLYTKRKAPHRQIEAPEDVFRYVLMCRARIGREYAADPRQFWEQWLEERRLDGLFGHRVSRAIATRVAEEIQAVRDENRRLERRMEGYERVKEVLRELGLDPDDSQNFGFQLRGRLEKALGVLPENLARDLQRAEQALSSARQRLDELNDHPALTSEDTTP